MILMKRIKKKGTKGFSENKDLNLKIIKIA